MWLRGESRAATADLTCGERLLHPRLGCVAPYQVRLDIGNLIFVPMDTDDFCVGAEENN